MVSLIAVGVVLLLVTLGVFFTASAWLIRRDMNQWFHRLHAQLEQEALALLRNVPDEHTHT